MSEAKNPIPSPQPGDSEDLELALETAQRMYAKGDKAEALKWLRRATNAAEEAGDDMRQLQLARLAADLAAVVDAGSDVVTSAPSVAPSAPSVVPNAPASPPPSPQAGRLPQPPVKQSPSSAPVRTPVPPKPSGGAAHPQVMPSRPPSAPSHPKPLPSTSPAALAAGGTESQVPAARANEPHTAPPAKPSGIASVKPRPIEATSSSSIVAAKPLPSATPSARPDKPNATGSGAALDGAGLSGSIRVSVRVSARDEQLLIVRPLAEGQRLPPNSRAARLVFEQDSGSLPGQSSGE